MKKIVIEVLNKLHEMLVLLILFGWLLPRNYLIYYIFLYPLLLLHWKSNNGNCILTDWWIKLSGKDYRKDSKNPFMSKMFKKYGINLTDKQTTFLLDYVYKITWLIAVLRYFNVIKF
jgi:hypothetical protein